MININNNALSRTNQKVTLIVIAIVGTAIGGFWLPQSEWGVMVVAAVGAGAIALLIALHQRSMPSPAAIQPGGAAGSMAQSQANFSFVQLVFYVGLASLAIGWRQLWITSALRIHPAEVILWGLFALLILQRQRLSGSIPRSVKLFTVFGLIGLFTAYNRGIAWDVMLAEFKAFLIIIPTIYIVYQAIQTPVQWRTSMLIIAVVTFYISLLGLIEYFVPALVAPFQGIFFTKQHVVFSQQGFARAAFTFWGSPIVNVYLAMVLVPILSSAKVEPNPTWRLFLFITVVLCALGVYVAGGRGSWLGASASLALYVFFSARNGWLKLLLLLLVVYNGVLTFLPEEVFNGIYAAFDSSQYYDTSALERQARAQAGLELIKRQPWLGFGWGASGWVHSDLIQIGANLGIPALVIFLAWILSRLGKTFIFTRRTAGQWPLAHEYGRGLLAGLLAAFISLAVQAIYVIPPLIIPLWLLLAMVDRLPILIEPRQKQGKESQQG